MRNVTRQPPRGSRSTSVSDFLWSTAASFLADKQATGTIALFTTARGLFASCRIICYCSLHAYPTKVDEAVVVARGRQLAASGTARMIRESAGLSLADVAAAIGVSRQSVWAWEHGAKRPGPAAAIAYADLMQRLLEER
jgi:DNA-binding XRE family transcriptional regulator